ncbi:MAG: SDR family NAD(P)-dependent oxidoreductase [Gammaproteobacteria bacterium]|nr:SDR family NAD(P)-dependent oxidoreductase [Gammaproteobacteria bacterium]
MKIDLNNRIALVIGGTGSLGTAICTQLSKSGAMVITDYNHDDISNWQQSLQDAEINITAMKADITDFDECVTLVENIENQIGPIDIIVNSNELDNIVPFNKMDVEQWDEAMTTNIDALFNICRNVADKMCDRGFGRIINISSIIARMGESERAHLAAAKSGIHGFTMALSQEVGKKGVTVNTVSPGMLDQVEDRLKNTAPKSISDGENVAYLVDFLCSDQAAHINGVDISINGGEYLH